MGWYVHSLQMQIGADSLTMILTLDLLNPKSVGCDSVEDYYCVRFQIIPISGTHPDTHPHTHIHIFILECAPRNHHSERTIVAVPCEQYYHSLHLSIRCEQAHM